MVKKPRSTSTAAQLLKAVDDLILAAERVKRLSWYGLHLMKKPRSTSTAAQLLKAVDDLILAAERVKRLRAKLTREAREPEPPALRIAAELDDKPTDSG